MQKEVYISVDIESTAGHSPGRYSMYQVGACLVENLDITFFAELKLLNSNSDPRSLRACGVTLSELLLKGVEPKTVMRNFAEWINFTRGGGRAIFVGFNTPFDWKFVDWYFHEFFGFNPFGVGGIDIKAYYMGMMACGFGETIKRKVKKRFPCSLPHTHNALDYAREQAELFRKLLEFNQARKVNLMTVSPW